jgi:hypothetical protein
LEHCPPLSTEIDEVTKRQNASHLGIDLDENGSSDEVVVVLANNLEGILLLVRGA